MAQSRERIVARLTSERRRSIRLALPVALLLAAGMTAGCGSRLDDEAIVNALASRVSQGAQGAPDAQAAVGPVPTAPQASTQTTVAATRTAPAAPRNKSAPAAIGGLAVSSRTNVNTPESGRTSGGANTAIAPTRSTLTFGNIATYSGLLGAIGVGNKYALAAWVSMQNVRGGLDGHPIKLIIGDDRADPITGLTIEKRMVENDHILAFVGNINVFGFEQYADYATSKGVPFIGGDAVNPRWFTDPNAFPSSGPLSNQIEAGLQYFVNQGSTRLAIAYCLEVAKMCTYLNEHAMKAPVGKYVIVDEQVSLAAPSYTSQCLRMQAAKADVAYLMMDTAGAARFVQNCATQGYRPKVVVLGLDATAAFPGVEVMQGSYVPGATVPLSETQIPAVAEYRAAMAKYAPGIDDSGTAGLGWVGGLLLGRAGAHLPDKPTAADLKANLWKIKNDNLGGFSVPLTFPTDKPAVPSTCVFIWGVKDHKFFAPQGPKAVC
jgi:branched-chain amino acid transport system substrate-binding protein